MRAELIRHKIDIDRLLFYCFCGVFFLLPLGTSLTLISSAVVLSIWLFSGKAFRDRGRWLGRSWALPVFAFILLHWVGLLYTNDVSLGLSYAKKSYYWLMAFAVASVSLQGRSGDGLIKSFIAGLTVMSLISLAQFAGILPLTRSITSIFSHHITNSLFLVTGMLMLSFMFREARDKKHRVLILFGMALFFLTITLGTSRSGYLAFILMSPLIIHNIFGRRHIIIIALSVLLVSGAVFLSPTVQSRISEAVKNVKMYKRGNTNTSIGLRLVMWEGAIKIIQEDPVFGVGTGGYMKAFKKHNDSIDMDIEDPHSSFFYMATSFGVFGLACLFWLLLVPLRRGWANRQSIIGFSIFSFTAVIVIGSLMNTQIISVASGIALALFVGLQEHLWGTRSLAGEVRTERGRSLPGTEY